MYLSICNLFLIYMYYSIGIPKYFLSICPALALAHKAAAVVWSPCPWLLDKRWLAIKLLRHKSGSLPSLKHSRAKGMCNQAQVRRVLETRSRQSWDGMKPKMIAAILNNFRKRLDECISAEGSHFKCSWLYYVCMCIDFLLFRMVHKTGFFVTSVRS